MKVPNDTTQFKYESHSRN